MLDTRRDLDHMKVARPLFFLLCFLLLLWFSLLSTHPTQAQGESGATPGGTLPVTTTLYLPVLSLALPPVLYEAIPVLEPPTDRPPAEHGDLNLALRSYTTTTAALTLLDLTGDTDSDAPQLAGIFAPPRLPTFVAAYRVYDWNWNCGAQGCRGLPISEPPVTLLEVAVTPNEWLYIPTRVPEIYVGGYKVLVLYAEATRLTLVYTREDTVARGYALHLEDLTVDAGLLALYQTQAAAGRKQLPALRNGQRLGVASGSTVKIAIRDTGSFMDPRSRKDWWQGY